MSLFHDGQVERERERESVKKKETKISCTELTNRWREGGREKRRVEKKEMNPFEQEEATCMLIGIKKVVECGWKRVTFSGKKATAGDFSRYLQ